ncbi:MAG: hypothetical protein JOZ07_05535 [Solirubrobacterales bacterium]|nr:hypothetical protein [Solirubrobacterales bacterium]
MMIVTTPTGRVGSQVLHRLLDGDEPIRVIVRGRSRLDARVVGHVDIVEGSHDDLRVLDRALAGADSLFWLVPPSFDVDSPEIERTGVNYRALSMPVYMDNLLDQVTSIRDHGVFLYPFDADRLLASVATRDIAHAVAPLLADGSWDGQEHLPVFGPDRLSLDAMAEVISDVLDTTVTYRQVGVDDVARQLAQAGANEAVVRGMTEMMRAQNDGIYDEDQSQAVPGPTSFQAWCADVLRPAAQRTSDSRAVR